MKPSALSCQIFAIGDHVTGPAGAALTLGDLRTLSDALRRQARRVEQVISERVQLGIYAGSFSEVDGQ
ncbi:hypothetical protein [Bradyrhizobium elkanii]|uniref:Uncharacterized protein n=1 Tax=Bradyrhizobium elkanii TaxID=29448 RepID=A0ABV4F172_BRAEL|nr:hypothetical protein [Bradyrhizobium elkanii]MCP1758208.1 hypothetical protein [Bradyrhizobium elkanii]MCP1983524.1 hypothetical protein [Bradyrhizobium elkanii]MCS3881495.1 hypothetical protein [Bradyrhizobium elkanii]MCS4219453.1 hypothetical protein [Bradyrhizobium elkanii]MCW2210532.1 hypothetical protein [Bradyrhizobium elkanii]